MCTERKWVVVRIDGKIAAISTDYRLLAEISRQLAYGRKKTNGIRRADRRETEHDDTVFGEISASALSLEQVWALRETVRWDDLILFGTEFQKKVWKKLWELTHDAEVTPESHLGKEPKLICYTDFAELCQNRAGVRAVAHAVGLNPISVILPCHLVIPKETIDRIRDIRRKAETTIFKGDDLCIASILKDPSADFGNYALGRDLKRTLIQMEFSSPTC